MKVRETHSEAESETKRDSERERETVKERDRQRGSLLFVDRGSVALLDDLVSGLPGRALRLLTVQAPSQAYYEGRNQ